MLDIFNIPSNTDSTKTFYANSGIGALNGWQTWIKPRNAKFIQIFCLGSGGGGAGGALNTAGSTAASGGGGGASGFMRVIYPANVLPDTLYVLVGVGGAGGTGSAVTGNGQAGAAGSNSVVAISPSTAAIGLLAGSNTAPPGGGAAAGTGGTVPTVAIVTQSPFSQLGIYNIVVGLVGIASEVNTTALATTLVTGGAGGGTKPFNSPFQRAGGSILPASVILTTQLDGLVGGGNGGSGYGSMNPFCGTGGAGGGGNLTGNGGNGGNGFYGSGGGGGGAGLTSGTSFTGGRGGKGGDGLVIITTIT
jgi:hypothetical protein